MPQRQRWSGTQGAGPRWAADYSKPDNLMPFGGRLDATGFRPSTGIKVNLTANALAAATSLTVTALGGDIPRGALLDFGGGKFAKLSADAVRYATTVTVEAIPTAMVIGDNAYWNVGGIITVPSGTFVGRTAAEVAAGAAFGPWAAGDTDIYLTWNTIDDIRTEDGITLYRPTSRVIVDHLPNWASLSGPTQTAIKATYQCITAPLP